MPKMSLYNVLPPNSKGETIQLIRRHRCPVHGWEVCYMTKYDNAHGCATAGIVGTWPAKTVEMAVL